MSRIVIAAVVSLALVQPVALASATDVTPVIATPDAAQLFVGTWSGRVTSEDRRFSGDVEFRFAAGGALIVPPRLPARIMWVRLTADGVSGALEPYFDDARHAYVYTTFEATLHDATLSGVLTERVGMRWTNAATWSVERRDSGQ